MKKMTVILAGAILLLAACNKEIEKRSEVTKENLVGTYKLIASESQLGTQPVENDMLTMEPCEKDDLSKLNADMSWNEVDAGTRCDPPGDEGGTWSLPSTTEIIIGGQSFTIKSFDGRTLVIEYKTGSGNSAYRSTATLSKQ